MSSSNRSHPVKTKSFNPASETNSLIFGEVPSVRFPTRMVPIWVSDPMGLAKPLRMASTPATKVVATAPIPGIIIPSFPFGGWISLWRFDSAAVLVEAGFAFFGRVGMFRLLPYEFRGFLATAHVLVLPRHLQQKQQRTVASTSRMVASQDWGKSILNHGEH